MAELKKERFEAPYEFIWKEKNSKMLHFCNYLICDDGCDCEQSSGSPRFYMDFFKKYYE